MLTLMVDGSNIMWRSFFAKNAADMTRKSDGMITGGVVNFIKTLVTACEHHNPTHGAVVFDGPGPSFRALLSKRYKASREHAMPEGSEEQIPYMRRAVECLDLVLLNSAPYEADDIIASLSRRYDGVILSDDKDLGSLVRKGVVQQRPRDANEGKHPVLDTAAIKNRWGIPPHLVSDVLSLSGDGIDEVVGLKGVGLVTATQILLKHGSVEKYALAAADETNSQWMKRAGAMASIINMTSMTRLVDAPVPKLPKRNSNWPQRTVDLLIELEAYATAKALARRHNLRTIRVKSSKTSRSLFQGA